VDWRRAYRRAESSKMCLSRPILKVHGPLHTLLIFHCFSAWPGPVRVQPLVQPCRSGDASSVALSLSASRHRQRSWVSILFARSRRREDRAPPCDLTTASITSRTSSGECALPPRCTSKISPNHPRQAPPRAMYRVCAPRHCCTRTCRALRSRCSAEGGVAVEGGLLCTLNLHTLRG
jgi:hypothetical protein